MASNKHHSTTIMRHLQITDITKRGTAINGKPFITFLGYYTDEPVINNDISQMNFPKEHVFTIFPTNNFNLFSLLSMTLRQDEMPVVNVHNFSTPRYKQRYHVK